MRVEVGDMVYVPDEDEPYKVKVRDDRYIICTKPYKPMDTVKYFIVDLKEMRRGPDNMVFCSGYETTRQCKHRLHELQKGKIEVSQRYGIMLDVDIE